jgi:manganese oxidase
MGGMKHGSGRKMGSDATTPQLAGLAGATSFRLISGMVLQGLRTRWPADGRYSGAR